MLHLTGCKYANEPEPRMSSGEFTDHLIRLNYDLDWFARYTGANLRTVQRWEDGSQDIPRWVPVLLRLHDRLREALAWSEEHGDVTAHEIEWRMDTCQALWEARQ